MFFNIKKIFNKIDEKSNAYALLHPVATYFLLFVGVPILTLFFVVIATMSIVMPLQFFLS